MTLPNFLVIGAAKGGTSAFTRFLESHPQAHIPFKEPNFFSGWETRVTFDGPLRDLERADRFCGTREKYERLFSRAGNARAVGEASVSSLPDEGAARLMRELVPSVKLIAFLRQPVDRAFSHFNMNRGFGTEPERDFRAVMRNEGARVQRNWHPFLCYGRIGRYAEQLARYQALFPAEQLRVYLYEDWNASPERVWRELMGYLDLDASYVPDFRERHNETRVYHPGWTAARAVGPWLKRALPSRVRPRVRRGLERLMSYRPRLDPAARHELTHGLFREDILRLQDMLRRDLSRWLN